MFTTEDILQDRYKSKSQEEIKKNGCVLQCVLQKSGVVNNVSIVFINVQVIKYINYQNNKTL